MQRTGGLGRLGEGRELVRVTRRATVMRRGQLRLRLRSRRLEHGKAVRGRERVSQHVPPGPQGNIRTSIGWHASPKSTRRPFR